MADGPRARWSVRLRADGRALVTRCAERDVRAARSSGTAPCGTVDVLRRRPRDRASREPSSRRSDGAGGGRSSAGRRAAAGEAGAAAARDPAALRAPPRRRAGPRPPAGEPVSPPFRVEPLSMPSDLDGVLEVDRLSFPSPWTRAMYEEELRQPETSFIIVLRTGTTPVAGYCTYRLVVDELQISNVAVRPEYRKGMRPRPGGVRPRSRAVRRRPNRAARRAAIEPSGAAALLQRRFRRGR